MHSEGKAPGTQDGERPEDNNSGNTLPQAAHQGNPRLAETLRRIRCKIFVMSGKGGVGKSSVTVNLAAALASLGLKVGVLDVDLHGPSVPGLLGIKNKKNQVSNGMIAPVSFSGNLKIISIDTLIEDNDQAVIWRGPKKAAAIQQFIAEADWGELDFLVIDSPPGTGDEHLTILRMIPDALCLVVTTPQEVALADVRKALNFLRRLKARVLGIVENMSAFPCPHCGKEIALFKPNGGLELALGQNLPFLGAIPLDPAASEAAERGVPAVLMDNGGPSKAAFFALAENVRNAALRFCTE